MASEGYVPSATQVDFMLLKGEQHLAHTAYVGHSLTCHAPATGERTACALEPTLKLMACLSLRPSLWLVPPAVPGNRVNTVYSHSYETHDKCGSS